MGGEGRGIKRRPPGFADREAELAAMLRDLGDLEGPLVLFGGPYSNLRALEALFDWSAAQGVGAERMICTGDLCAYGAEPEEVVSRIVKSGCHVIAGNTDIQLGERAPDCGCGFADGSACDLLSARWFSYADAAISEDSRLYLASLPKRASFTHAGARYSVIHGGASEVSKFIWPTDDQYVFRREIKDLERDIGAVDGVICGHSGVPFERRLDRVSWINAGAIGMPAHNGDPYCWFAVLEGGEARLERLSYDHVGAAMAMRSAGLPSGYADALETGWWPNEDVLPDVMRRPRGAGWAIAASSRADAL